LNILQKTNFKGYEWLNFENLLYSKGSKFELHANDDLEIEEFIILFFSIFGKFINEIQLGQFGTNSEWGNFCIDVWDVENDRYDYSLDNKSETTSLYLKMLFENEIEPTYAGYCKCYDWDKFIPIIINCIINHSAPYSLMFYIPSYEFVFYLHHTNSFGIYYKKANKEIEYIIAKAKTESLEVR